MAEQERPDEHDTYFPEEILETEVEEAAELEDTRTADLLRRLLDDNRAANKELIERVTAPKGVPLQKESVNPELEFTLEGLPDPAYDLPAFHREYAKRMVAAAGNMARAVEGRAVASARQAVSDQEVISRADAMIKAAIPGVDDDVVAWAGTMIANKYKAEGRDPMKELHAHTDAVAQDISDFILDKAEKLGAPRRTSEDAPAVAGRTRGTLAPRTRAPAAPRAAQKSESPTSMLDDLKEFQRKARIY